MDNKKIMIGMSGGVDSSVAALRLLEQGHEVTGLFMKNWDEDDGSEYCTAKEDLADAQQVSDKLGIELKTVNFAAEYWDNVFEDFLSEYAAGRTPNPDILCNREIKFKAFLDYATELGADYIATGHYTQIAQQHNQFQLLRGLDNNKDQSYFLYTLGQTQLSRSLFPIGNMEKPAVRELAQKAGFINSRKKDSTGICFIGERKFKDFLQRYLPAQPGLMNTPEGETIGEHQGLMYYTLGQRQGLGIGGIKSAAEEPWYVVEKDLKNNILVVAQGHDHTLMQSNTLNASQLSWVSGQAVSNSFRCTAKTRYRQKDQACQVTLIGDDHCLVQFDDPQRAVTPGQSVVFYNNEVCLGGGIIDATSTINS
ncbi:MAG: tRNA-specific 2-thiouridylase [Cycloclasticus pugetii]|jgi:tRNA-specific 2-thiouridylase|nr:MULTISPECIES: tRNA 2-thiouridine(34) synthase MnmA [Cycloclasticus]AFT67207.1 tRNA (5-methylaminomethyl-2-thiouridylate)-methyltransferase [Cycloclasticus sp. P1]PHR49414.1 MAG: tRNA 2-thiouridine(34) synthase MnmA [Cycloclasticus sp.]|tara:strand:- start:978 stop:2075 length:1098 start_codon:yes stop_codon:yes gene_type:complete